MTATSAGNRLLVLGAGPGGYAAAFLAADANESVTMTHLLRTARTEYVKLEKPLTEAEIGGWA